MSENRLMHDDQSVVFAVIIQVAAERTPRFGRGIASGGERLQYMYRTCTEDKCTDI